MRIVGWFSCGITSAVACKLAVEEYGPENVYLFYIGIKSAHDDNDRFIRDCEKWIGVKIRTRSSPKYKDQYDVIEKEKYINGPAGARCTLELKMKVRQSIQREFDITNQVFGFEFSLKEINRAIRFAEQYPVNPIYPLIDKKLTKPQCADILLKNGIRLPHLYELGFHNNNCIGCVKGGRGYWNHIRKHFPDHFDRMAGLERMVGHTCIKHQYLDELKPTAGRHEKPIVPECGTFCEIEFADIIDPRAKEVETGLKTMQQISLF